MQHGHWEERSSQTLRNADLDRRRSMLHRHYPHVGFPPITSYQHTHKDITRAPHYPGEDEKLRASNVIRRRGGNCPNSIEVLQQLIQHCPFKTVLQLGLVSVLPANSSAGVQQVQSSLPPGVDLSHCIYREQFSEPASSYIIKSQASGSRTIVNYNELPEMEIDEFSSIADRLGQHSRLFHFEVRSCLWYISSTG